MSRWKLEAEELYPGYFALVMATGILSVGAFLMQQILFAHLLFVINSMLYAILWALTITKIIYFAPKMKQELQSHQVGPAYFTMIAGTTVYGTQVYVLFQMVTGAFILWMLGLILWLIIIYTFFTSVIVHKEKPTIRDGINGAWLIAVVATQSLAVLGMFISPELSTQKELLIFFSLCMYLLGCMLYIFIMVFIFYRLLFVEFNIHSMAPPYWIAMGAVAITTLAGSNILLHSDEWILLQEFAPFLKGFTLFFWVTGTWWIPLLIILSIWRYVYHRDHPKYDPQLWAMVFPIAMYGVGTYKLGEALNVSFLSMIPKVFFIAALLIWILVFWGFIGTVYRKLKKPRRSI